MHDDPPVATPDSAQIDLRSSVNDRDYRLLVGLPGSAPPPPAGYPVLVVLDGNAYFGLYNSAARMLSQFGRELDAVLVVAIGYPDPDRKAWMHRRLLDLTACQPTEPEPEPAPGEPRAAFGDAERFFDTIAIDVARRVRERWPVDAERSAIVGHSLGGLAVLHALFTRPAMFKHWIAVSPAIWFAERAVLAHEATFAAQVRGGRVAPRIHLSVGAREQQVPRVPWPDTDAKAMRRLTREARMVDNLRELAGRLSALRGAPGYVLRSRILPGENHASAPFGAACDALRMAFSRLTYTARGVRT